MFLSTRRGVGAVSCAGVRFAGGGATSLGILGTYTKVPGEIGPRCADEFHRTPKDIAAVQARFQMAARRRNKPPPTSPPAQPRHARSETQRNAKQRETTVHRALRSPTPCAKGNPCARSVLISQSNPPWIVGEASFLSSGADPAATTRPLRERPGGTRGGQRSVDDATVCRPQRAR